jgi:mannose-6-phosphate isomerase-like protein (cupin superfamily)
VTPPIPSIPAIPPIPPSPPSVPISSIPAIPAIVAISAIKTGTLEAAAFRIAPGDTNYFCLLCDPRDGADQVCVVEIFSVGGRTPPNSHQSAHEFFYVLAGEGVAICDGRRTPLVKGDALLIKPGAQHVIENTGAQKLYTLTLMVPNEGFAELIRAGEPVLLDDEDRRTLGPEESAALTGMKLAQKGS